MNDKVRIVILKLLLTITIAALLFTNRFRLMEYVEQKKSIESSATVGQADYQGQTEQTRTGLIDGLISQGYTDERKPDYLKVNSFNDNPTIIEYTWTSHEMLYFATVEYTIDEDLYQYYKGLSRYYNDDEFVNYITDPINDRYIDMVVENLGDIADKRGYSEGELIRETVNFVQSMEYVEDNEYTDKVEWPKYPIETLYDRCGDCEDTAILLVGILSKMGYGCSLIKFEDHMAVGLKGDDTTEGSYYEMNGIRYYYIETTGKGWSIGEIPVDYQGRPATVIVMN